MTRVVLLSLVAAILFAAVAIADRKPTRDERDDILVALAPTSFDCDNYPPGSCRVDIRISTKNERWAGAYERPVHHDPQVQPAAGSLKLEQGRWKVHRLGPDVSGCGMPNKVRRDLHLECY